MREDLRANKELRSYHLKQWPISSRSSESHCQQIVQLFHKPHYNLSMRWSVNRTRNRTYGLLCAPMPEGALTSNEGPRIRPIPRLYFSKSCKAHWSVPILSDPPWSWTQRLFLGNHPTSPKIRHHRGRTLYSSTHNKLNARGVVSVMRKRS
jgi:hypothetical protein